MELHIAYLYPKLLNLYGDYGNILAISNRAKWREIEIFLDLINVNNDFYPEKYDFFFIGGGQDTQQIEASKEIQKYKGRLQQVAKNGAVFLGICGGYQLLANYYQPYNASRIDGISLLNAYSIAGKNRFIGNVSAICDFVEPKTLVGFENHSGLTYLEGDTKPIATVKVGNGNNGEDKTEGARQYNVFGTYLHGSFLPKNPQFADLLIKLALEYHYQKSINLISLNDNFELNLNKELFMKNY